LQLERQVVEAKRRIGELTQALHVLALLIRRLVGHAQDAEAAGVAHSRYQGRVGGAAAHPAEDDGMADAEQVAQAGMQHERLLLSLESDVRQSSHPPMMGHAWRMRSARPLS